MISTLLTALEPLPVRYKKLKPQEARSVLSYKDSLFNVSFYGTSVAGLSASSSGAVSVDDDSLEDIKCRVLHASYPIV